MDDIVIDNSVARHFENPPDAHYRQLILWLQHLGSMAVSKKLFMEIKGTTCGNNSTSLLAIIGLLVREDRINRISNEDLKGFEIKNHIAKKLLSNKKDHPHIKLVLLSFRKLCLSEDGNLVTDINKFFGYKATAANRPESLPYV